MSTEEQRPPHQPVVYFFRCWEAFCGPVEETVEEDEAGEPRPHPHDHVEGHACIIDQLGRIEGLFLKLPSSVFLLTTWCLKAGIKLKLEFISLNFTIYTIICMKKEPD